jgi:hypothetical protein
MRCFIVCRNSRHLTFNEIIWQICWSQNVKFCASKDVGVKNDDGLNLTVHSENIESVFRHRFGLDSVASLNGFACKIK